MPVPVRRNPPGAAAQGKQRQWALVWAPVWAPLETPFCSLSSHRRLIRQHPLLQKFKDPRSFVRSKAWDGRRNSSDCVPGREFLKELTPLPSDGLASVGSCRCRSRRNRVTSPRCPVIPICLCALCGKRTAAKGRRFGLRCLRVRPLPMMVGLGGRRLDNHVRLASHPQAPLCCQHHCLVSSGPQSGRYRRL